MHKASSKDSIWKYSNQNLFAIISIFYLSFLSFICNHLKTKVFSTTVTSYSMAGLSLNSIRGITIVVSCL